MAEAAALEEGEEPVRSGAGGRIWSGTVSFGLVSIPVNLVSGTHSQAIRLRMLSGGGTALQRRYACSVDGKRLEPDEIARGYDTGAGNFVVIEDEELEALAPEQSRDIDLRLFVEIQQIPPIYFDRPYYLVPAGGSTKAYRLLAQTMESSKLAGIATFVMRGKEYLIAIVAEHGLLRAETMRFADEIRSADQVGLPAPQEAAQTEVRRLEKVITKHTAAKLDTADLIDERNRKLLELIANKEADGSDVVRASLPLERGEDNVIDLMEKLKQSLQQRERKQPAAKRRAHAKRGRKAA